MLTLDQAIPWGRSFDEYAAMFTLADADIAGHILGCGDGPASFNSEATRRGSRVVSCDPIYAFSKADNEVRIAEIYEQVFDQIRQNQNDFVWEAISSVEELGQVRMTTMQDFLADYPAGLAEGRYLNSELPSQPFPQSLRASSRLISRRFLSSGTCSPGSNSPLVISSRW
jgi:hypothetical protein